RAGRAGYQNGAVGLPERRLEPLPARAVHAEVVERALGVVLVEDADRHALALLGREGRDAEVDAAVLDRDADPAVLGNALLGDVQVAHDLDPGDDGAHHPFRDVRSLPKDAINAETDTHVLFTAFEMNIGGTLAHRLAEDAVDEFDHRRVFGGDL